MALARSESSGENIEASLEEIGRSLPKFEDTGEI